MAKARARSGRALIWLVVIGAVFAGLNWASVATQGGSWTPRLALDLEGGTQVILEPQLQQGEQVTEDQLNQAVEIIRQRVDASGISESEITTQGGQNIVVAIPGEVDDATMDRLQSSARMEFRPVLTVAAALTPDEIATNQAAQEATPPVDDPAAATPADASDLAWITPTLQAAYDTFDCAALQDPERGEQPTDEPLITCSEDGTARYILGPVEVEGADISDATFGQATTSTGAPTGEWEVRLQFDAQGTEAFDEVTSRITSLESPRNQFGVVLDGAVVIAPASNAVITNGEASITGGFTQDAASSLADQLKFGSLPIGFEVQSEETIAATLGESQLQAGIIAGLIGLLLVIGYSIFQYRALASVTIASLVIAGGLSYLVITWLSSAEGYRLSLAGVTGLIISIGLIADSFIVYFERVRDELRDGRALTSAVEAGWRRAWRTIVASKALNLLAAVVLYLVAVGNVRGFAFTIGITAIIDLVVVALFTHPMLQLVARTRFFSSGHPMSGLDPKALGAVYRGRAQFRDPVAAGKGATSSREAQRRQSIAERKASASAEQER
ncbi:protein translocase subunit SecD [Agrococcus jejuensis]|uniref:protein translocase subunit SecD n=1 Tax=Agrococcus jejuensis TaxID=399736 RepID=UPI0011A7D818|nr:protein translocase subunit SecD [Agrococcus jejuensis]